jgi:RNA polymerase sigma factor (TIGR02999 family)
VRLATRALRGRTVGRRHVLPSCASGGDNLRVLPAASITMPSPPHPDLTELLADASSGDRDALSALFPIVYDELRQAAAAALRRERPEHTLQPTALVHETFLRLADDSRVWWENRSHFLAIASKVMRRILVEHARGRNAQKRGSGEARRSLDDIDVPMPDAAGGVDLVALDDALARLASLDPRQARIVELRFFGGLTVEETATVIGSSPRTVKRDWQVARAWLKREMARLAPDAPGSR